MGIIDDGKLQNILPKYSELKLSGKNLAQQYVSAFNTGMNIYQCINQLQGYIEWVVKAVNDVVVQWNEILDKQLHETIENVVDTRLDTRLDTFTKIAKIGMTTDYYVLTETKDKLIIKLDYYIMYNQPYTKGAPYYSVTKPIRGLDLSDYTLKTAVLKNNIFKLTDSSGKLIDYVYLNLNNPVVTGDVLGDLPYTEITTKFTPAVTKFTGKEEANGNLDINTCITLIFEKTSQ